MAAIGQHKTGWSPLAWVGLLGFKAGSLEQLTCTNVDGVTERAFRPSQNGPTLQRK